MILVQELIVDARDVARWETYEQTRNQKSAAHRAFTSLQATDINMHKPESEESCWCKAENWDEKLLNGDNGVKYPHLTGRKEFYLV